MAKKSFESKKGQEEKKMSLEESRAFRASLYKPTEQVLSESEKREKFRIFWAEQKSKYGKTKDLEEILWVHLKASKLDDPSKFEQGLQHFGLKVK